MRDQSPLRRRLAFASAAAVAIALGLASRRYRDVLPTLIAEYAGDTLWAVVVFFGVSCLWPHSSLRRRAAIAGAFALVIELSQLSRAPWLEALRRTTLGGLVLGFGFLWSDLACYGVGIAIGAVLDHFAFGRSVTNLQPAPSPES